MSAMSSFVATGGNTYTDGATAPLTTTGATGGTFNPNGEYHILYMEGSSFKYQNNVSFTNGNANISVSAMATLE
jgi:hypothetical protein